MFDSFHEEFLFFLAQTWPTCVQDPFVPSNKFVNNVRNLSHATFEKVAANYQGCLEKHWTLTYEVQLNVIATIQDSNTTASSKTSAIIDVHVPVLGSKALFGKANLSVRQQPDFKPLVKDLSEELQMAMNPLVKQLQDAYDSQSWPSLEFSEPAQKVVPCQKGHPYKVPKEGCGPCDLCCQCQLKNTCDGACRSCDCICEPLQRMSPKWFFIGFFLFGILLQILFG